MAAVVVSAGLAYQYSKLQAKADENRRLLENRMDNMETRLLEDAQTKYASLSTTIDERCVGILHFGKVIF